MSMWDDEAGYDYDDPKHPTYADRMFDLADMLRKAERENAGLTPDLGEMLVKEDEALD